MANMNIRTPRFYVDNVSYRLSRGVTQDGAYDVMATNTGNDLVGIKSGGGVEADLFDMKPLNQVTFDTSASSTSRADHVVVSLDGMGESNSKTSFIAILNHNMQSANAKFRVGVSDTLSHVQSANFSSATIVEPSQVINADTIGTSPYVITPATNGSTIITYTEHDYRYIGIQFEGISSTFSSGTDLQVGCILVGEYYDMPHAPDLAVKRKIMFDKVSINESLGGQRYSNSINYGRFSTTSSKSPFSTANDAQTTYGGRISYDMSFSYLFSTDVMPDGYENISSNAVFNSFTDDSVVTDVWNKTNGNGLPFIFTTDNTSTGNGAESDYIFARFAQNELEMNQVAPDIYNVKMKIEEEF